MDDREEICSSLIKWLETFSPAAPHTTALELSDGVAIAQTLTVIAPTYFTESWFSKIKTDDLSNWRFKVTNLKKVLKGILEYSLEVLGVTMQGFQMPDVNAIGEHADRIELSRFLQLVLHVAINCENKQEHIQGIMSMGEEEQQSIKSAIQELMTLESRTEDGIEAELRQQLKKTVDELNAALEAKEELLQRCHELDAQVASLQEERQSFLSDNEKLLERLQLAESLDDPSTPAGKRCAQLQHQIENLQEELYKLESGKEDYRIKFEVLNKDFVELKDKNSELSQLASESRAMKDELDVLRHTSEQVTKYESAIESYKKKLEEFSDLRGQLKLLEEKNTNYMQQQIEMEEELKRTNSLKQQLESYKRQTLEIQNKMADETKRADKAEFEFKRIQEKHTVLLKEKERVQTERDSLREMNDDLKFSQLQTSGTLSGDVSDVEYSSVDMMSLPPEIKEKILRLQHENKMLKMRSATGEEDHSGASQELLDEANAKKNELETEVRLLNQRLMEVQAELEDLQESQQTASQASNSQVVIVRKELTEAKNKLEEKDLTLQQKQQHNEELESKLTSTNDKVLELSDLLVKKEEEVKVMEEKYRKYLEKAKNVIKSLDPRQHNDSSSELFALKNQLQEKDRYISFLEKDQEKTKGLRNQEERLIATAWYNLGMQLNRQAAEERLANSSMGQSFLARQRQVHTRRANNTLHNSTSPSLHQQEGPLSILTPNTKRRFSFRRAKQSSPLTGNEITRQRSLSSVPQTITQGEIADFPQIRPNHFNGGATES